MSYGANWPKPEPFIYHPFASLPKNGWRAGALPKPPRGWRWLNVGETATVGDLCCDPRSDPVEIAGGQWEMTGAHHPVLSKTVRNSGRRTRIVIPKNAADYFTRSDWRELQDELRQLQEKWHSRAAERRKAIERAGRTILASRKESR